MEGGRSYRVTLLRPSAPRPAQEDQRGGEERAITVGEGEHIWDAAKSQGVTLPAICHQGRCLTCAGQLEGAGDFDSSDASHYYPADRQAGFILLCTAKPRSDLIIRTDKQHEMRAFRRAHRLPAPYS
jgi:ferredoxin